MSLLSKAPKVDALIQKFLFSLSQRRDKLKLIGHQKGAIWLIA
jgi:hypothetical protein